MTTRTSVLLPTIQVDGWLDEAIGSLMAQDVPALQIVVVFDGVDPADDKRPWMHDPSVTLVPIPVRGGLANALRAGMVHVQGDYVARLDADDRCLPGRIRAQASYLDEHPDVVALGTEFRRIGPDGHELCPPRTSTTADVTRDLCERNTLGHSTVMFRRLSYEAVGGYRGPLKQMEDYDLWLRLALVGRIHRLGEVLVEYRLHPAQMSRGAAPTGPHIDAVLSGRMALARHLHLSLLRQRARNGMWLAAQLLRFRGWRRNGHEAAVSSSAHRRSGTGVRK